jgi:hypothetical protein
MPWAGVCACRGCQRQRSAGRVAKNEGRSPRPAERPEDRRQKTEDRRAFLRLGESGAGVGALLPSAVWLLISEGWSPRQAETALLD